jgi:dTDP-4-amino-4,6-dideoxygalactose transaminase
MFPNTRGRTVVNDKPVPFSPPDISDREIEAVVEVMRSGWLTTGPRTRQFEEILGSRFDVDRVKCINSATAGLELVLRLFGIGEGDEVITTPYTYAATVNVILHVGATPVLVDTEQDTWSISPDAIAGAITEKTKAVIPVDIGGWPCDYDSIHSVLEKSRALFSPKPGTLQEGMKRPLLIADAAHSIGAIFRGSPVGSLADFTIFSFHAVKNITTAEGGAILFRQTAAFDTDDIYTRLSHLSLHGQNKNALEKQKLGSWHYDIVTDGYKYNMTDIAAAMGMVQLDRYDNGLLERRRSLHDLYNSLLGDTHRLETPIRQSGESTSSCHLYMVRLQDCGEEERNMVLQELFARGIAGNVHFIPIPMHTFYRKLGYRIEDYPNAYKRYANELTLPLYPSLMETQVERVVETLITILETEAYLRKER